LGDWQGENEGKHVAVADDTLFFCETNVKSVFNIKAALYCFELSSRLKVNFMKSKLGGLGVEQIVIQCFVAILNCEVMVTPFVYLGFSVGGCHKRRAFWDGVVGMKKSLSWWKGRFYSLVGRVYLIKSVLSSIPLFYLSLFKMSEAVTNELVKIQRNFLWGWGYEGRKVAWASWKKVCEAREDADLGIIYLRTFNLALLSKWVWRLGSDKGGLWKKIIVSKYEGWRSLREEWKDNKESIW